MRLNSSRAIVFLLSGALVFSGCATQGPVRPKPSPLQTRSMQIRDFPTKDKALILGGVMNLLQDEGYIIKDADKELGFLTGRREVDLTEQAASGPMTGGQIAATAGILAAVGAAVYFLGKREAKHKNNGGYNDHDHAHASTVVEKSSEPRLKITECTITLTPFGESTRVRANFEEQILNENNQVTQSGPVHDLTVYQEFFQKLDKSLFLEKELARGDS